MVRSKWAWLTAGVFLLLVVVGIPVVLPLDGQPTSPRLPLITSAARTDPSDHQTLSAPTTTDTTIVEEAIAVGRRPPDWLWSRMDPQTLADVPTIPPLRLGAPGRGVFSPDGKTLASFTYALETEGSEELLVVDLEEWEVRAGFSVAGRVAQDQSGVVEGPVLASFTDDGDTLVWISQLPDEPRGVPEPADFGLFRHELGGGGPQLAYAFAPGFAPWEMRLLGENRIAVFGQTVVYGDQPVPETSRWPQVVLIDLATGHLVGDLQLPGLIAGHLSEGEAGSFARPGLAWDLSRDHLYVVHADRLALTAIDLEPLAVIAQEEIALPSSLGEGLMAWLLPAAQAKSQEGTRRNVRIDPEGQYLYVSGVRWELVYNQAGQVEGERQVPLGLTTVIRLDELDVAAHLDLPVSDVEVSPDGGHLLLSGVSDGRTVDNDPERSGLFVLDPRTLEQRAHLLADTIPWVHAFSPDGDAVFITIWDEETGAARLLLLDLVDLSVAADRSLAEHEQVSFDLPLAGLTATWIGET